MLRPILSNVTTPLGGFLWPAGRISGAVGMRAGAREPAFVDDQLLVADRPDAILYIGSAALRRR
jgi:hypothetical protein